MHNFSGRLEGRVIVKRYGAEFFAHVVNSCNSFSVRRDSLKHCSLSLLAGFTSATGTAPPRASLQCGDTASANWKEACRKLRKEPLCWTPPLWTTCSPRYRQRSDFTVLACQGYRACVWYRMHSISCADEIILLTRFWLLLPGASVRKWPNWFPSLFIYLFFFLRGSGSAWLPEGPGSTQDVPLGGRAARHRKWVFGDGRARHHSLRQRHGSTK